MQIFKIISLSFSLFIGSISFLFSSAKTDTFQRYPNEYFVESGSFFGDGIDMALKAGFKNVYSIELAPHYYNFCKEKFKRSPNVVLFYGDSSKILYDSIKNINTSITFWLDGHYSGDNTAMGETHSPILKELDAIKKHHINTHTLLIDDIRLLGTISFDYTTLASIIKKILEINPNYEISFVDGYVPNDILVAEIKNENN